MFFIQLKMIKLLKYTFLSIFVSILIGSTMLTMTVNAQSFQNWSPPYRLSTDKAVASEAALLTDKYGFVHVLWKEEQESTRSTIQYSRFDGSNWTIPNDIHATNPADIIDTIISADIDEDNIIHLVWVEGFQFRITYSYVHSLDAGNSKNWSKPIRLDLPSAGTALLKIDPKGGFHLLYTIEAGDNIGLYYVRSTDKGYVWSAPLQLDPDIPANTIPADVQFQIDENGVLHAVWYYFALDFSGGDWVRYSRSVDGGDSWSVPFTIDKEDLPGTSNLEKDLSEATPRMIAVGETVHIVWGVSDQSVFRYHRYSNNSGETWSRPARVFGDLNGQAGDGFTVDGAGRVHFFSQIRFPRGIYHMIWDRGEWSIPSLAYLISASSGDPIGPRIHAHRTYPIVRAGNQLVVTFTDPPGTPNRRLFVIQRTLDDIEAVALEPTPIPTPTAIPVSEGEVVPTPDPRETRALTGLEGIDAPAALPSPGTGVWIGTTLSLFALVGLVIYWVLVRLRH